jgi:hypothetical protein
MESRTSPGKKGSVQPISECLAASSCSFLAWVSQPVSLALVDRCGS